MVRPIADPLERIRSKLGALSPPPSSLRFCGCGRVEDAGDGGGGGRAASGCGCCASMVVEGAAGRAPPPREGLLPIS